MIKVVDHHRGVIEEGLYVEELINNRRTLIGITRARGEAEDGAAHAQNHPAAPQNTGPEALVRYYDRSQVDVLVKNNFDDPDTGLLYNFNVTERCPGGKRAGASGDNDKSKEAEAWPQCVHQNLFAKGNGIFLNLVPVIYKNSIQQ